MPTKSENMMTNEKIELTQGVRCKLKFYKLNEMSCTMFDYVVKSVNNDMEMLR